MRYRIRVSKKIELVEEGGAEIPAGGTGLAEEICCGSIELEFDLSELPSLCPRFPKETLVKAVFSRFEVEEA